MPTNDNELLMAILDYLIQFVSLFLVSWFSIRYVDKKRGVPKRPKALWLLGLLLVTFAGYDLLNFLDYDYYELMFKGLPQWLIVTRYCFSILLRCLIIYITLGVMYFHEWARKLLILISVFTILTVYWKHPYTAFENTAYLAEEAYLGYSRVLRFPDFPWYTMLVYVTADILIAGLTIYCLTLPDIKALFKK